MSERPSRRAAAAEPVVILGAGRVGAGLAAALVDAGAGPVVLWNRTPQRVRSVPGGLRLRFGPQLPHEIEQARLILVAVHDAAIPTIGAGLRACPLRPGVTVAHTSGALPGAALGRIAGAHTTGLHPLVACPSAEIARQRLRTAAFVTEPHPPPVIVELVRALGGSLSIVPPRAKARYHAAAVMAANLVVALVARAIHEAQGAGLSHAEPLLLSLAAGAIAAAQTEGLAHGLTGPIARGDVATVRRHLATLGGTARPLYVALSRELLTLAPGLSRRQRRALGVLLDGAAVKSS